MRCRITASFLASATFAFCNGPVVVNPFCALSLPGSCFCTGSAQGCRLMVFEEERVGPILDARGCPGFQSKHLLQALRPDPIHRPGRDAAPGRLVFILPENRGVLLLSCRISPRIVSLFG